MIASHRTAAMLLMTIGGSILFAAACVPFFLAPPLLAGSQITILCALAIGLPLLVAGACVYSQGKGYSAWLGLLAVSFAGLFVLMFLPDRRCEGETRNSFRKTRRLFYCAASPFFLLALFWVTDLFGAFFSWGSFCKECGASRSSRAIFWIPFHCGKSSQNPGPGRLAASLLAGRIPRVSLPP